MAQCLIGCGSNQGLRREQLDGAVELLRFMPGVTLQKVSRLRETRPIGGPVGQAPFLNSACLIETDLSPHEVLGMLTAVENTLHRERGERWGPRTIDLDLLLYDDAVIDNQSVDGAVLTIPHPRMSTRRFVLEPAAEIAGSLPHPLAGCSVQSLLENISQPHLHVAVVGVAGSGTSEVAAAIADTTLARCIRRPAPLPESGSLGRWQETLAAWTHPLQADTWPDESHGTISDYWLELLVIAAAGHLQPEEMSRLRSEHAVFAQTTMAPNVAILLLATPESLLRQTGHSETTVATLLACQERLVDRLRGGGRSGGGTAAVPKAVVAIDASDLRQATLESVAAVEALL